jgi:hypothetical protein
MSEKVPGENQISPLGPYWHEKMSCPTTFSFETAKNQNDAWEPYFNTTELAGFMKVNDKSVISSEPRLR